MPLPILGVGLNYCSALAPILRESPDLVDVVEVEPQSLWYDGGRAGYRVDAPAVEQLAAEPFAKILHGVGFPVGGSRPASPRQIGPLLETISGLSPAWMSEHLSFNEASSPRGPFQTAFLLPPRQTLAGVEAAVASIQSFARELPIPVAVEVGVNYLAPRPDEMDDGAFVAEVLERAGCGLLLDLHNLWCNERNGRQRIERFLAQIPLERVWEIHVAGGQSRSGYWLDGHCGEMPDPVLWWTRELVPHLPALGALIFETFPAWVPHVGLDRIRGQLERLREIWSRRSSAPFPESPRPVARPDAGGDRTEAASWEDALGGLIVGCDVASPLQAELALDPAIELIRELLGEFRASMVVTALPLTSRLLMKTLGVDGFTALLRAHWRACPPEKFTSTEADRFAESLRGLESPSPYFEEVLAYERAVLAALTRRESRVVRFRHDPLPLLRALGRYEVPEATAEGAFEVEVTP